MLSQTKLTIEEQGKIEGIEYFSLYYNPCAKPWFHKYNMPRKIITTVNRINPDTTTLKRATRMCQSTTKFTFYGNVIFSIFSVASFLENQEKLKCIYLLVSTSFLRALVLNLVWIYVTLWQNVILRFDTCKNNYNYRSLLTVKQK